MKVSKDQVVENRRKVLQSAGRLFRERGLDAVTLNDVMNDAGLTRGAFYGHFTSKDDLVAAAVGQAVKPSDGQERKSFSLTVSDYLSPYHRDHAGDGCAFAALASEIARQPQAARQEMTDGLKARVELMSAVAPGETPEERRHAAIAAMTSMTGALILARMSDDPAFSDELLGATREALLGKAV